MSADKISILLVDDEILALEYMKNAMDWEKHGYQVSGCATSAKKALDLCGKNMPQIVISDIQMPGMDGLELARRLKEKNPDVAVILLTAYKDFEYAQKGIQYGVSNYLVKHELCEETLFAELDRIRERLEREQKREKIYQKYFMNQLIYDHGAAEEYEETGIGNRLFLMLIHKRNPAVCGEMQKEEWNAQEKEALGRAAERPLENKIFYAADIQITPNNWLVLYQIENTPSTSTVNRLIEQKSAETVRELSELPQCCLNVVYSREIAKEEISATFRQMSQQIRHALFWSVNKAFPIQKMPCEEKKNWSETIKELRKKMYDPEESPHRFAAELMGQIIRDNQADGWKSLISCLQDLIGELEEREGVRAWREEKKRYTAQEIIQYYEICLESLHRQVCAGEENRYSRTVSEMVRYIRKNYKEEITLELLGEKFQMNGVYLGQMFKKEVGVTFLKYLTNLRMKEAKRLLGEKNSTVAETARLVGYQTSQYFSQIFAKNVGMKPQEYKNKKWKREE